jgi:peptidoglycan/LPS O-acetylase OafA/YrhL
MILSFHRNNVSLDELISIYTFTYTGEELNTIWWALSVEMQFYLIAPVIAYFINLLKNHKFTGFQNI